MKGTDGTQDKHGMQACITLLVCNLGKSFHLLPKKKDIEFGKHSFKCCSLISLCCNLIITISS